MKMRNTTIGIYLACIVMIFAACTDDTQTATYKIKKGDLRQTLMETGELEAVMKKDFVMPMLGRRWYRNKIVALLEHGTKVNVGDTIYQIDPDPIIKFIEEKERELDNQRASLNKMLLNQEIKRNSNTATLQSAEADFEMKKLEQNLYQFESETTRKIKNLEFEKAQIRLQRTKSKIELNEIVERNDLKIQKLRVFRDSNEVQMGYEVMDQLAITTSISGIFQRARKRRSSSRVDIGDEIYYNRKVANVPDLTWMKVLTKINEADYFKVKEGQKVIVRLDALPTVAFQGEVSFVNNVCRLENKDSRQKIFDVEVKCLVSDPRLKPGMTVSCEFVCADLQDVLYVPNACIQRSEGNYFIYVKNGSSIDKVMVNIGARNNYNTQIIGDLKEGQKIVATSEINKKEE